ncbi:beta-Ala-His dipeptidase [Peptoniphilus sp. SGI.035]|uniref:beta-Ala-His dipeptidase n=1 Tax=Peptoniphilus sp. SGI.035 TaxID=3420564 RepID=UPI003D006C04
MKKEELLKNNTLFYFNEISKIPRGSGNEEKVSKYIYNWAIKRGYTVKDDKYHNLIIKKDNNKSKDSIILQAHLDMVCEKTPESNHNFLTDPIEWEIADGFIKSKDGTTLGADCGIGVALIMAMLDINDDQFPPIEAILTTREETDMAGAYNINKRLLSAKRMINLDISPENKILVGSSGGFACEVSLKVNFVKYDGKFFELKLTNMHGGHSGNDINKGYGNPLILLVYLYKILKKSGIECSLSSIDGGNSRLAIPREASIKFGLSNKNTAEYCKDIINKYLYFLSKKYNIMEKKLNLSLSEIDDCLVFSEIDELRIINLISLIPNGIFEMDNKFNGLVESSSNLGVVKTQDDKVILTEEIRSAYKESGEMILEKIKILSDIYNCDIRVHSKYPGWTSDKSSKLSCKVKEIFKSIYNENPIITASHSGNEVAILKDLLNLEDAIAIGPTRLYYHTPSEVLDYVSVIKFEKYLEKILKEI